MTERFVVGVVGRLAAEVGMIAVEVGRIVVVVVVVGVGVGVGKLLVVVPGTWIAEAGHSALELRWVVAEAGIVVAVKVKSFEA